MHSLRRPRQQLSGFLLRQECDYGRPAWTRLHRRWLPGLKFEQAVHHLVLEDYIPTVDLAAARRDRLRVQIEAILPDWTLTSVVAALQTMRGMALVNAKTLIAELGDLTRFVGYHAQSTMTTPTTAAVTSPTKCAQNIAGWRARRICLPQWARKEPDESSQKGARHP
jgi:hypothetical protein